MILVQSFHYSNMHLYNRQFELWQEPIFKTEDSLHFFDFNFAWTGIANSSFYCKKNGSQVTFRKTQPSTKSLLCNWTRTFKVWAKFVVFSSRFPLGVLSQFWKVAVFHTDHGKSAKYKYIEERSCERKSQIGSCKILNKFWLKAKKIIDVILEIN